MRLTRLSRQIAGQAALVTSGASGMARATALLFADAGACVAAAARRRVPLRRYGDPEEVAHVLVVDGGLTAPNTRGGVA